MRDKKASDEVSIIADSVRPFFCDGSLEEFRGFVGSRGDDEVVSFYRDAIAGFSGEYFGCVNAGFRVGKESLAR